MIADLFIMVINFLIWLIGSVFGGIIAILPEDPIAAGAIDLSLPIEFIEYMNWIFPFGLILTTINIWIAAIIGYFLLSIILRVFKIVD